MGKPTPFHPEPAWVETGPDPNHRLPPLRDAPRARMLIKISWKVLGGAGPQPEDSLLDYGELDLTGPASTRGLIQDPYQGDNPAFSSKGSPEDELVPAH